MLMLNIFSYYSDQDMFRLWSLAETDLLNPLNGYRLRDTGQGLNRMQHAPKTARMMQLILQRAQKSIGFWVGSSVIHMGDHNVPNALMFIDKYSQIYRILLPICTTISHIPELTKRPELKSMSMASSAVWMAVFVKSWVTSFGMDSMARVLIVSMMLAHVLMGG